MKLNKIKTNFKKAFTLVELIIVIAVIAILAVFIVPNFSNVLGDAGATNIKSDAANIKNIVMAYINETGAVPVINTDSANGVSGSKKRISLTLNGKTYEPGVSLNAFQNMTDATGLYVIDMDLLTKDQVNIDDKMTIVKAKLPSIPGTSAIIDVIPATTGIGGTIKTNRTIKNTSVIYCVDRDLNVYAVYNKAMKKNITALPAKTASPYEVLNPSTTLESNILAVAPTKTLKENHSIFKTAYISDVDVNVGFQTDDSNFN